MSLTLWPGLGTYSSCWIASSTLSGGGGACFQCSLINHGWMISMGSLPVSEEKQGKKSRWEMEGSWGLGKVEGKKSLARM